MLKMLMTVNDVGHARTFIYIHESAPARALPNTAAVVTYPGSIFTTFYSHQHLKHVTKPPFSHIQRESSYPQ
jgi:hypothetical protein